MGLEWVVATLDWSLLMRTDSPPHNPFLLMMNPEIVLAAIQRSEKLGKLASRICHPLDRPAPTEGQGGDAVIRGPGMRASPRIV